MTLLQLSLRTILWILFAAAVLTGWGWERWLHLSELAEVQKKLPPGFSRSQGTQRLAKLDQIAKLSEQELRAEYADPKISGTWIPNKGPWLTEMTRRDMTADLQFELDALANAPDRPRANAGVFTCLRRAEGKPDPVHIDVNFADRDTDGKLTPTLYVEGIVRNGDVDREPFRISWGGDSRGGRRDRWRVELRDEQGTRIPDSNYISWAGGGRGGESHLKFGESCNYRPTLDPRKYVAPPRSGRYQLQLLHSEVDIAAEPEQDGLIVWKSAPMWVEVVNRETEVFDSTLIRLGLVIGLAIVVVLVTRAFSPPRAEEESIFARWGDVAACVLIITLAVGWWYDGRQLRQSIANAKPNAEADWTLVAPNEQSEESGGPKGPTKK